VDEMLRKLRGLLGVGLGWGAAWAVIGAGIGVVLGLLSPDVWQSGPILEWALGMGLYGLVSGAAFGKLIAFYEGRRTLDDLTLGRMAAWGVAGSAAVPLVFWALGMFEPGTTGRDIVEAMLLTSFLGGTFAAGSLALARRAADDELAEPPSPALPGARDLLTDATVPDPLERSARERERSV
jgi:hypothetical protein